MFWFRTLHYYIRKNIRDPDFEPPNVRAAFWNALAKETLDLFYFLLASFTYLYLIFSAAVFFLRLGQIDPVWAELVDVFSEPYLGSVGIYVILKEVRKRRRGFISQHAGEIFVALWLMLLVVSSLLVLFSPHFSYTLAHRTIIVNSVVVLLIYLGSVISKP